MTERTCGNCRWFVGDDLCFRYPKENATEANSFCGEWSDKTITPEQEEMRELTRRFAVALINDGYDEQNTWKVAAKFAAAEPQIQREVGQ